MAAPPTDEAALNEERRRAEAAEEKAIEEYDALMKAKKATDCSFDKND